ncbi:hypothetical protein KC887_04930 [Candidatus Kaiserbacteria bacterium]|nr:hypothetical protein [Candidatus Kaiserbacteria bacterium]
MEWTSEQLDYQQWLALPKKLRQPKTVALLAKQFKVDPATMWRWSQKEGWWDAVNAIKREAIRGEYAEIMDALISKSKDGDVPAIKLFMEMIREYTPKQELTGDNGSLLTIKVVYDDDD